MTHTVVELLTGAGLMVVYGASFWALLWIPAAVLGSLYVAGMISRAANAKLTEGQRRLKIAMRRFPRSHRRVRSRAF